MRFLRTAFKHALRARRRDDRHSSLTVVDLAELAAVSRPAAHQYATRLRQAKFTPPEGAGIAADVGYVIGIDVRETHPVRVALLDAHGEEICSVWQSADHESSNAPRRSSTERMLDDATRGVLQRVKERELDPSNLIGVGISLQAPGVVAGAATGLNAGTWADMRADQRLAKRLSGWAPKLTEASFVTRSDTYCSVLTEAYWGTPEAAVPNLIYIKWSVELSAAIVLNGEIYTGPRGTAGQIGHIPVPPAADEPGIQPLPCAVCQQERCVHALASLSHLSRVARESKSLNKDGTSERRDDLVPDGEGSPLWSGEAIAAIALYTPDLMRALRVGTRGIGLAVSATMTALTPETVTLGGAVGARVFDSVREALTDTISERDVLNVGKRDIVGAGFEHDTAVYGAAIAALLIQGPDRFKHMLSR